MISQNLLALLIESSSLREDLLNEMKSILLDILNNIKINDELCARVSGKTFDFITSWNLHKYLWNIAYGSEEEKK